LKEIGMESEAGSMKRRDFDNPLSAPRA